MIVESIEEFTNLITLLYFLKMLLYKGKLALISEAVTRIFIILVNKDDDDTCLGVAQG